jgi:hypothetical protein
MGMLLPLVLPIDDFIPACGDEPVAHPERIEREEKEYEERYYWTFENGAGI